MRTTRRAPPAATSARASPAPRTRPTSAWHGRRHPRQGCRLPSIGGGEDVENVLEQGEAESDRRHAQNEIARGAALEIGPYQEIGDDQFGALLADPGQNERLEHSVPERRQRQVKPRSDDIDRGWQEGDHRAAGDRHAEQSRREAPTSEPQNE
jgi:hypothetical protein